MQQAGLGDPTGSLWQMGGALLSPILTTCLFSEWAHGWQYFASDALEQASYIDLKQRLAFPHRRINAQAVGKTRLESCRSRFAASFLTAYPGSLALTFRDDELQSALRLRLGLATCFDGPDPFGYRRLAENLGGRTNAHHKLKNFDCSLETSLSGGRRRSSRSECGATAASNQCARARWRSETARSHSARFERSTGLTPLLRRHNRFTD